jgi:hypothetical protein
MGGLNAPSFSAPRSAATPQNHSYVIADQSLESLQSMYRCAYLGPWEILGLFVERTFSFNFRIFKWPGLLQGVRRAQALATYPGLR